MAAITREILKKGDATTSAAVMEAYKENAKFKELSARLCKEIQDRDTDDGVKLQAGVQIGIDKGVLSGEVVVEPVTKISVTGKSPDQVCDEITKVLGDAPSKGCIMVLQGLSGTGKGTTVAKLKESLPNAQTWSNGNLFRSYTLLAVTYMEQNKIENLTDVLTKENLANFASMLSFDKYGDKFDVKIEGLGLKYFVSETEKTVLKDSKIGKNIPTIAEVTQGEVVTFVQGALDKMAADGINCLVEGREQTLNHLRTPHRFELVLDDPGVIGQRQAALQMGAKADKKLSEIEVAGGAVDDAAIEKALADSLADLQP